jgi:hypothetical protein
MLKAGHKTNLLGYTQKKETFFSRCKPDWIGPAGSNAYSNDLINKERERFQAKIIQLTEQKSFSRRCVFYPQGADPPPLFLSAQLRQI